MSLPAKKALIAPAVGAFLLLLVLLLLVERQPQLLVLDGSTMGTQWQVQVVDDGSADLAGLAEAITGLLLTLDKDIFSTWASDSELSRLNASVGAAPVQLSPELFAVLQAASRIHHESDGAFDPGIGPLVDLWGFGPEPVTEVPGPEAIAAARERLGMAELQLDAATRSVIKPQRVQLDLSGIAKGYAVDRVVELLLARGLRSFLVEIGGELRLQGLRADGQAWRVAIERPDPDPEQRSAQAVLDSGGQPLALAGSGDYRNYRLIDGVRQSHEIDPLSGVPVQHTLAAVTVLADTAMEADAWATALMVLGPADGQRIANRLGLSAYFIIRDREGWASIHSGRFDTHLIPDQQSNEPAAAAVPAVKE